jgi:hypothetical protein
MGPAAVFERRGLEPVEPAPAGHACILDGGSCRGGESVRAINRHGRNRCRGGGQDPHQRAVLDLLSP